MTPEDVQSDLYAEHPPERRRSRQGEPGGYKIVSIRLRSAEFDSFFFQAQALGLSSNLALRIAARRIGGFLEVDRETREQLEGLVRTIGEISRNIGSLHAAYADSGAVDAKDLARQRAAFGQEFAQLDALLRSILNVSQRRSDGRQMLAEAMT